VSPDCCRPDYDVVFGDRAARRELAAYRRKGASRTTRDLLDVIRAAGVADASVLDIGGGVGVIGAELLTAGAASLIDVDASRPYLEAARGEMERRGFGERSTFRHGDFVELAAEIEPADVVTLDRVVCCYGDWVALVDRSVARSRRLYGLVYPRDRWMMRAIAAAGNVGLGLFRQRFRFYVHPERAIDARIRAAGFEPIHHRRGLVWQSILYRRVEAAAG
jgi:magnesium-protoporphyrin O-methyltransferase